MVTPDRAMFCASTIESCDGIRHGFFTRQGGVSKGIYGSLNCGLGSRDDAENVRQNRILVAETLGVVPERLLTLYQIHSATALIVDKPWNGDAAEADALVTRTPGLAIGALTADCAPVLFCDPEARVIATAHAGWRGALFGVVEATVASMEQLGAKPERMVAVIGPTISQRAYEVGTDYVERFLAEEPSSAPFFMTDDSSGEPHFDLAGYVAERLARAGIGAVSDLGLCTYCDETRLFSYRRSQHHGEEDYGRQISAIVLA
ncbi:peptidoglycan editing factor PgeF [Methyloceanibacter sp.]|uniref:peptidoglycan editing factor PgeF n=1 Tax=Methyloceanibacter sp. TaxID=1965321 RepID=UPI003D6D6938